MNNELVPQPSWWKNNWKWVLPVGGCLSMVIIGIIAMVAVFYTITSAIEDSQPYEYALEKINTDEALINTLGSPIVKSGIMSSSWSNNNGKKTATMAVPISGPKGEGTLYVEATGEDDDWSYNLIRVEIGDTDFMNLNETELEQF